MKNMRLHHRRLCSGRKHGNQILVPTASAPAVSSVSALLRQKCIEASAEDPPDDHDVDRLLLHLKDRQGHSPDAFLDSILELWSGGFKTHCFERLIQWHGVDDVKNAQAFTAFLAPGSNETKNPNPITIKDQGLVALFDGLERDSCCGGRYAWNLVSRLRTEQQRDRTLRDLVHTCPPFRGPSTFRLSFWVSKQDTKIQEQFAVFRDLYRIPSSPYSRPLRQDSILLSWIQHLDLPTLIIMVSELKHKFPPPDANLVHIQQTLEREETDASVLCARSCFQDWILFHAHDRRLWAVVSEKKDNVK